jgi:hypothetical protein
MQPAFGWFEQVRGPLLTEHCDIMKIMLRN